MIRIDSGEKIELHKHNVKFDDAIKEIIVDSDPDLLDRCRQGIILLDTQRRN